MSSKLRLPEFYRAINRFKLASMKHISVTIFLSTASFAAYGVSVQPPPLDSNFICSANTVVRAKVTRVSLDHKAYQCSYSHLKKCDTVVYKIKVVSVIKSNDQPLHVVTSISDVLAERETSIPAMTQMEIVRNVGREYLFWGDLTRSDVLKQRQIARAVPVDWYDEGEVSELRTRCADSR